MQLTASLNLKFVEEAIVELQRRGQDLKPALRVIRKEMRADQREHARDRKGPDGKWPERAAATIAKARKGSGRARRPMGRVTSAMDYIAGRRRVVGVSRVPWYPAHVEGDTVGHGAKLPVRIAFWISDKLIDVSATVLGRFLVHGWGR